MSQRVYVGNRLYEEWDDDTRVYTRWSTDDNPEIVEQRPYTEEENEAADEEVVQNSRLTTLEERVTALELLLNPPKPGETPAAPLWEDLSPPNFWYNQTLLEDVDGVVYRNISGNILTTPPSKFPGGGVAWRGQLFEVVTAEATTTTTTTQAPGTTTTTTTAKPALAPWSPDAILYKVGDRVTYDGRIYSCRQEHTSQTGWTPVAVAALWTDEGPII